MTLPPDTVERIWTRPRIPSWWSARRHPRWKAIAREPPPDRATPIFGSDIFIFRLRRTKLRQRVCLPIGEDHRRFAFRRDQHQGRHGVHAHQRREPVQLLTVDGARPGLDFSYARGASGLRI